MNFFKKKKKQPEQKQTNNQDSLTFQELMQKLSASADFSTVKQSSASTFYISYYKTLVNPEFVHRDLLPYITDLPLKNLDDVQKHLPLDGIVKTNDVRDIANKVTEGFILLQMNKEDTECLLIPSLSTENRQISIPETEFSVVGPKEAFVESLDTNLNLIRKRLPIPEFIVKEVRVGKLTKTRVAIIYIDGIADRENVNTAIQRVNDIEYDHVVDSSFINQMISDNGNSPFPQLIDTERPDRVASVLAEGKVAIMADGSPHALTGPTTIVEFFSAFEDYFLNWVLASAFRLIRLMAVMFSVLSTPLYVAVLTFHYEMIPENLLATLVASRNDIPFPPILEAMVLELSIELLREAGARLPTKVGQTIGIVGGIVIGTAAVQAGLTSNVLLIIVALAALASFTTPVYQMSNTIRLLRFPFLLFAQFLGVLGVTICFAFILAHLLKLTSLGRPYIAPLYPLRTNDLKDALIRMPFSSQFNRPDSLRPSDKKRMNKKRANEKHDIED
ncbi:spore germination protein [Fictibacillus sp. b24]|uniref:spore germination protein n=1 Tax=Fictibacillus sp. b24 TaxID=3055863 RepID=UPI003CD0D91C